MLGNKGAKPLSDASKQAGAGATAAARPIKASQPAAPPDKRAGGAKATEQHHAWLKKFAAAAKHDVRDLLSPVKVASAAAAPALGLAGVASGVVHGIAGTAAKGTAPQSRTLLADNRGSPVRLDQMSWAGGERNAGAEQLMGRKGLSASALAGKVQANNNTMNVTFVDDFTKEHLIGKVGLPKTHGDTVVEAFKKQLGPERMKHVTITRINYGFNNKGESDAAFADALKQATARAQSGQTQLISISNNPTDLDVPPVAGGFSDAARQQLLAKLNREKPEVGKAVSALGQLHVPVVVANCNDGGISSEGLPPNAINVGASSIFPSGLPGQNSPSQYGAQVDAIENGQFFSPKPVTSYSTPLISADITSAVLQKVGVDPDTPNPMPGPAGGY